MNRERKSALIAKIKELDGLDDADKSALIELLRTKTYGLVWENRPENVEEKLRTEFPVLVEVKEKAIVSDAADAPNHIVIEGDNLQALTALSYTHAGKVDVIYIDPPYNTGNKDFKYNDKFVDAEDEYRHSKWLSFMYKRLKIAKQLLSDTGVIFISIDDNELAQLKLLCDEVFGSLNFVAKFDWRKKTGANDAKDIAVITESILLFANEKVMGLKLRIWDRDAESINQSRYRYKDEYFNERGLYYYDTLDRGGLRYSDSLNFGITAPDGKKIYPNGRSYFFNDGWIWKWGVSKVEWGLRNGFLEFCKKKQYAGNESAYTIKYKVYQNVDNEGNIREQRGRAFSNLILSPINQQGNEDMVKLFGETNMFSNPKPIGLIQYLIKTLRNKDSIILDFFAGSGTTMHAVMQLNEEDGGHRQCILVNNNENEICENVTYERNKRVINGYTTPKGVAVEGLKSNSLRYYKMDFIPRERTASNRRKLMAACTDLLCIKNDVYMASDKIFSGLKEKDVRYFEERGKRMLVIYNEAVISQVVELLKDVDAGETAIKVYVFSYGCDPFADEFIDVADKVELCALPQAIYDAYRRVLPKEVERDLEVENEEEVNHD